ncbi:MAG: hypothetical protein EBS82_01275 [Methylocystaceae bacterium]|nr:hypothetical protein [Methylocystaceae bacterium]
MSLLPRSITTSDPQIRSLVLYPAELRAHSPIRRPAKEDAIVTGLVYRLAGTLAIAGLLFLPNRRDPWRDFRRRDAQRGHNG